MAQNDPPFRVATAGLLMAAVPYGILWRNVLVHAEQVIGIVTRLDGYEAFPAVAISLWHSVGFVAAHKVDIDSGHHRWPQPSEQIADPRDIEDIVFRLMPVSEQIHNEWSASIAKGGLIGPNPRGGATQVCELNLTSGRRDGAERFHHCVDALVSERFEIARLGVVVPPMGKFRICHRLQRKERNHFFRYGNRIAEEKDAIHIAAAFLEVSGP